MKAIHYLPKLDLTSFSSDVHHLPIASKEKTQSTFKKIYRPPTNERFRYTSCQGEKIKKKKRIPTIALTLSNWFCWRKAIYNIANPTSEFFSIYWKRSCCPCYPRYLCSLMFCAALKLYLLLECSSCEKF